MHRGVLSGGRHARASARELLEHVLSSPVRETVVGLLDDVPDGVRLRAGAHFYAPDPGSPDDVLETLLEHRSVHLRCLVAYHVVETGLAARRDDMKALCDAAMGAMNELLQRSQDRFENRAKEKSYVVPLR